MLHRRLHFGSRRRRHRCARNHDAQCLLSTVFYESKIFGHFSLDLCTLTRTILSIISVSAFNFPFFFLTYEIFSLKSNE